MKSTNIVFWFFVIAALVALWVVLRFFFGRIGRAILRLFGEVEDNILDKGIFEEDKKL